MADFRELLTPAQWADAEGLLALCGLGLAPELKAAAYGVGLYAGERLVGTGFWGQGRLMGLCLHPDMQGEGVMLSLVDHVLKEALNRGESHAWIFTKASAAPLFAAAGFDLLASTEDSALLEWGRPNLAQWLAATKEELQKIQGVQGDGVTAVVVNANPLTLGHVHLLERASKLWQKLLVLVVEEDCSAFPFAVRLALVRRGTAHIPHCVVLPSGPYAISRHTFPTYFTGEAGLAKAHARLDSTLFATRLAPALDITARFVGSEPLSPVTALYNEALHSILPRHGVKVVELPRLTQGADPVSADSAELPRPDAGQTHVISASRVRALLAAGNLDAACALVPPCTQEFLLSEQGRAAAHRLSTPTTKD